MSVAASPDIEILKIAVPTAQVVVTKNANAILIAYGLGTCIGLAATDGRVAGLAHILLPDSEGRTADPKEPARFADTGVDALLAALQSAGASMARLVFKMAGGASVLGTTNAEKFKIGERNAEAVRERLAHHGHSLAVVETGGTVGRTLEVHLGAGKMFIRTAATPAREI